jgi:hypothetical protein
MRCFLLLLFVACASPSDPAPGGDASGDPVAGGDAASGDPSGDAASGDAASGGDAAPFVDATPGFCPVERRAGLIRIQHAWGSLRLTGSVLAGLPTFLGPPALLEPPCAHYHPAACPPSCSPGTVCSYVGDCVAPALSREDLVVSVNGEMFAYDAQSAGINGSPAEAAEYAIEVLLPGEKPIRFTAPLPSLFSEDPTAVDQGALEGSGSVTATWVGSGEGAQMQVYLKPNHHAPIGFSQCIVDDDVETVTASAEMIEPLRLATGFEGGYFLRQFVGSAEMEFGCVEISVGVHELLIPGYP